MGAIYVYKCSNYHKCISYVPHWYIRGKFLHLRTLQMPSPLVKETALIVIMRLFGQRAQSIQFTEASQAWSGLPSTNYDALMTHHTTENRRYHYGARGMHYHILLRQYRKNYYTYNGVVKNTYSRCQKDACVQISIGNTKWLLRYKGAS